VRNGWRYVLVAVEPDLHRALGLQRSERGHRGERRGLRLFSAEAAAHPRDLDHDLVPADAEHVGDDRLHLGGVLGAAVELERPALFGHRQRHLGLEIEVILPAGADLALELQVRRGQRGLDVAPLHHVRITEERAGREPTFDGGDRAEHFPLGHHRGDAGAARLVALADHQRDRLAEELRLVFDEQRLVVHHRPDVVLAGDVGVGEDAADSGDGAGAGDVEALELRVRVRRGDDLPDQQPVRRREVVDVARLAAGVPQAGLVRRGFVQRRAGVKNFGHGI
jgi:hypothetical protein